MSLDTLKASEMLQDAGLDATSAKAVVNVINEAVENTAATKLDLERAETRIKKHTDAKFEAFTKASDAKFAQQDAKFEAFTKATDVKFAQQDEKIDALREDFTRLEAKVDTNHAALNAKIDTGLAGVRTEIAEVRAEISDVRTEIAALDGKIEVSHATLDGKIDKGLAEVRTEIVVSARRTSRELMAFITFAAAVVGFLTNGEAILATLSRLF